MADPKDWWDKSEIVAKLLGVTLVPVIVASTAYLLNGQISERQANTEKGKLAIELLSVPAVVDDGTGVDPLRKWALSALAADFSFSDAEKQLLLTGERSLPASSAVSPSQNMLPEIRGYLESGVLILRWEQPVDRFPKLVRVDPVYVGTDGIPIISREVYFENDALELEYELYELHVPDSRKYSCGYQTVISEFCAARPGKELLQFYVQVQQQGETRVIIVAPRRN